MASGTMSGMRVVCLSDTHNRHGELEVPDGDVLLHAGDATLRGTREELVDFARWLGDQPHRHKLMTAGNHDFLFERSPLEARALIRGAIYLEDSGVELEGLSFWGSPWQPWFFDWAFNLPRGAALREKWARIPPGTDVLMTHGPPHGIGDQVEGPVSRVLGALMSGGRHVGCEELRVAVERLRPRLHVFGHIHEGYGREQREGTEFVNASNCDRAYRAVQAPIVVDL